MKKCLVVSCGVYLPQDRLLNSDVLERCSIKSKKVFSHHRTCGSYKEFGSIN